MKYIVQSQTLHDGTYEMHQSKTWLDKLRVKIALWLLDSVKSSGPLTITTTTGTCNGPEVKA